MTFVEKSRLLIILHSPTPDSNQRQVTAWSRSILAFWYLDQGMNKSHAVLKRVHRNNSWHANDKLHVSSWGLRMKGSGKTFSLLSCSYATVCFVHTLSVSPCQQSSADQISMHFLPVLEIAGSLMILECWVCRLSSCLAKTFLPFTVRRAQKGSWNSGLENSACLM